MQTTKIYVISLKRLPERRKFMEAQLSDLGLEAEFVEAVDGLELSEETIKANCINEKMTPTEIGCAWSHRNVYQRLIDSEEEYALVLEDDAVLVPDIVQFLELIPKIESDWELIALFWWARNRAVPHIFRRIFPINLYNQHKLELGSPPREYRLGEFLLPIGGAVGYLVSRQGAHLLTRHNTPIVAVSDYIFVNITPRKLLVVKPPLLSFGNTDRLGRGIMSRGSEKGLRTRWMLLHCFIKLKPYGNGKLSSFVVRIMMMILYPKKKFRLSRK